MNRKKLAEEEQKQTTKGVLTMKTEVKEIPFNGSTLLGVKDASGQVWLAIRKACVDIGLTQKQANNELEKVKKELTYNNSCTPNLGWRLLNVKLDGQTREVTVLNEKFVTLWLAKISLTPSMQKKNPEAVQKLLEYQLEAADVLHKAFYETEEQKDTFHNRMGLDGEIADLKQSVATMENKLDRVMENMTLTTVQQGKIQRAVKDRVNKLLGGAHSKEYKRDSRMYFINFWNDIKQSFKCGSRWQDLNPCYFTEALEYISRWEYIEA